jgi:hypothetical protein
MSTPIRLTALDGANPGAFLAALGVLEALHHQGYPARLRWVLAGGWKPEILAPGIDAVDALVDCLMADLASDDLSTLWEFGYLKEEKKGTLFCRDLKASPGELRDRLLLPVWCAAHPAERSAVDLVAGLVAEGGLDNQGKSKPTAFYFTTGNQQFLQMVADLRQSMRKEFVTEGLMGPWSHPQPLPVLGWDVSNSREWALRAKEPSSDKKQGQPAVEWLGFRGLALFHCHGRRGQTVTTGVTGPWKGESFTWPLWSGWLGRDLTRTVVGLPLESLAPAERTRMGIVEVLRSMIRRADPGGQGSMTPAGVLG